MVFFPGGQSSNNQDYYTPDRMRRDYERSNPGKSFETFLNESEGRYGKGSVDAVRRGVTPKKEITTPGFPSKPEPRPPAKPPSKPAPKPPAKPPTKPAPKPPAKPPARPPAKPTPKPAPKKK